jgi:hypothetical protein
MEATNLYVYAKVWRVGREETWYQHATPKGFESEAFDEVGEMAESLEQPIKDTFEKSGELVCIHNGPSQTIGWPVVNADLRQANMGEVPANYKYRRLDGEEKGEFGRICGVGEHFY